MRKSLKMAIGMWDPRFTSKNQIYCQIGSNSITATRICSLQDLHVTNSSLRRHCESQTRFLHFQSLYRINSTSYHCVRRLTQGHSTLVQIFTAAHRRYQFPRPIQYDIDNLLIDVVLSCRMGPQIHSPCFSIVRTLPSRFAFSLTLLALLFTLVAQLLALERSCTSPANLARARHKHPRSRSIAQAVKPNTNKQRPSHHHFSTPSNVSEILLHLPLWSHCLRYCTSFLRISPESTPFLKPQHTLFVTLDETAACA